MADTSPRLDGRSWAFLLALALLWSASFIFVKVASKEIPILTLALLRVALAALALHAFVLLSGRRYPTEPRVLLRYVVMGLINNALPFALIVYAIARIGAGAASILNATSPIFALLVAHVATSDEKITPAKLIGILLGIAGVAAMVGPEAVTGLTANILAVSAMLLASLSYGLAAIYGRGFRGIDASVSATCQLSASTLLLLPVALIIDKPWTLAMPSTTVLIATLSLALLSTSFGYVLYFALILRAGGTNALLVTLLIPVGGVFFAWALLGEAFTLAEAAGLLLIGLGLLVIDGRALRGFRRSRPVRGRRLRQSQNRGVTES
jgi:drug/metabolite transporter (DMT)-like permease